MSASPEPAEVHELPEALSLVFGHLPAAERDKRVTNATHLFAAGELRHEGLFVVRGAEGLEGAVLCVPFAGASAMLWPPGTNDGRQEVEDALLSHALAWLRGAGTKVVQCLLDPEESTRGEPLLRNGFRHVTRLWQLRHELSLPPNPPGPPSLKGRGEKDLDSSSPLPFREGGPGGLGQALTFLPYLPSDPAAFHGTLDRTYTGTLDCPEVNGVRTAEEVLAGYQSQPTCRVDRWFLAQHDGQPVGVLMLGEIPETSEGELLYMGLVPEARGHGWGRDLVAQALAVAGAADNLALMVCVDVRNAPAWQLYRAAGFEPEVCREVFLHF